MRRNQESRRNRLWNINRSAPDHRLGTECRFIFQALALVIAAKLILIGASGTGDKRVDKSSGMVFRVEGSKGDPEFERACGVVKSLEDLYGRERYTLQAKVQLEYQQNSNPSPNPRRWRWGWGRPQWIFGGRGNLRPQDAEQSSVLCSLSRAPSATAMVNETMVADTDPRALPVVPDDNVPIGGVEDLLEFVRTSVLAGPRPFSLAFHEGSLRIKEEQRCRKGVVDGASTQTPYRVPKAYHAPRESRRAPSRANAEGDPSVHDPGIVDPNTTAPDAPKYDYDLVVIGGGSGGLACAKEAAKLGQRVACLDFVKPSPMGTKWGLGGTCVNVGCIPKKLMHQASLIAGHVKDAKVYGWISEHKNSPTHKGCDISGHDWQSMVRAIQHYIKGLNFKYRSDLRSKGVEYLNALGRLKDVNTVVATIRGGQERVLKCGKIVVAVGGRPKPLICEGGDLAVTSDDLFSLQTHPGKTLVVGASYVALECAGFLTGLGVDTTVMVRSVLLRRFDQDIAERIGRFMHAEGTRFIRPAVPRRISKTKEGRLLVAWEEGEEEFDTVLSATGRIADVQGLGLESIGVTLTEDGKLICHNEETTVPGIFGIGDVVEGVPELTPAAVQAGKMLARRLYGGSAEAMDYRNVCTTVFTPLEYSSCGMSEDEAIDQLGEENVDVYHSAFTPLEWDLNLERPKNVCYVKAICNLADRQRIVGLHFLGPNAGEVMQGFGVGVRMGMTYDDLRHLIGIHPTAAEEVTLLQTTKRSGEPIEKSSC